MACAHPSEKLFQEFTSEAAFFTLPLKMSCDYPRQNISIQKEEYKTFYPNGASLVAKIPFESNFSLFIFDYACDYSCPQLFSFDKYGKRIDSLKLTPHQCGEDEFSRQKEFFLISELLEITLIDSMEFLNANGETDSIIIEKEKLKFSEQGKFESLGKMWNRIQLKSKE